MEIRLDDILHLLDLDVEFFHKGQYVCDLTELATNHWLYKCEVRNIEAVDNSIWIDTI